MRVIYQKARQLFEREHALTGNKPSTLHQSFDSIIEPGMVYFAAQKFALGPQTGRERAYLRSSKPLDVYCTAKWRLVRKTLGHGGSF